VDIVGAEADGGNVAAMRRANISELPTMAKITGLKPVQRGVTISMVALRSGPAKHCAMNEKTSMAAAAVKCMELHGVIDNAIEMRHAGGALVDISPGGIVDIQVRRSANFKVGHCGIIDLRVLEEEAEDLMDMAPDIGVLVFKKVVDDTPDDAYEAIIDDEFFPAGVIEQIYLQRGVVANVKRDLGQVGSKALVYQVVVPEGKILDQISSDGYLVQLGSYGKFAMRMARRKVAYETVYVYGSTGLESAKLNFRPAFADAIAQSEDLVRISKVPVTLNDAVVCPVKYVFSREACDAVDIMLDQGQFKLVNERTGSVREIYVAATIKELEKMLAFKLLRQEESDEDESDDDEPRVLDVTLLSLSLYIGRCSLCGAHGSCWWW
jgi:hypothetical protein